MEKNPEQDILVDPSWPILFDGHGYDALLVGGIPSKDQEGRKIITLNIKPSSRARKRYDIQPSKDLDPNGNMKLLVLEIDIFVLNPYDKANERWLYVKSFRHEETTMSEREKNLKYELRRMENRVLLLEADVIKLNEQLKIAKTNPTKYYQESLELLQSAGKIVADITNKEREKIT